MTHKILIAEDDKDIIELLSLYLSGEGFDILAAENGREALTIAKSEDVSAALVDIMMPVMNGYEFIRELRTFSQIPVIGKRSRPGPYPGPQHRGGRLSDKAVQSA